MPNDSSPDFRASQAAHAAAIQFERNLMDKCGVPRSEARKVLQSLRAKQQESENRPAVQQAPTIANGGVTPMASVMLSGPGFEPAAPKLDNTPQQPPLNYAEQHGTVFSSGSLVTATFYIKP